MWLRLSQIPRIFPPSITIWHRTRTAQNFYRQPSGRLLTNAGVELIDENGGGPGARSKAAFIGLISPARCKLPQMKSSIRLRFLLCMGLFFKKFLTSLRHSGADRFPNFLVGQPRRGPPGKNETNPIRSVLDSFMSTRWLVKGISCPAGRRVHRRERRRLWGSVSASVSAEHPVATAIAIP